MGRYRSLFVALVSTGSHWVPIGPFFVVMGPNGSLCVFLDCNGSP